MAQQNRVVPKDGVFNQIIDVLVNAELRTKPEMAKRLVLLMPSALSRASEWTRYMDSQNPDLRSEFIRTGDVKLYRPRALRIFGVLVQWSSVVREIQCVDIECVKEAAMKRYKLLSEQAVPRDEVKPVPPVSNDQTYLN